MGQIRAPSTLGVCKYIVNNTYIGRYFTLPHHFIYSRTVPILTKADQVLFDTIYTHILHFFIFIFLMDTVNYICMLREWPAHRVGRLKLDRLYFFLMLFFFDIVAIRRDLDGLGGAVSSLKIYK